jgi:hypothetical protein
MTHTSTNTTPYLRHYTSFTADSSTHTPSKGIKAEAITGNSHNNDTHTQLIQPCGNIQNNGACKYKKKIIYKHKNITNIIK